MQYRRRDIGVLALGWTAWPAACLAATPPAPGQPAAKDPLRSLRADYDGANKMTWYTHPSSPRNRKANGFFVFFGRKNDGALTDLRLMVQYHGNVWLRMRRAQCTADGAVYDIPPVEKYVGWKNDSHGGLYWEWADVALKTPAEKAVVRKIASAAKASLRFEGKHENHDQALTPKQLDALREVIAAYEAVSKNPWR